MDIKVAIIGCGAIGREIAFSIDAQKIPNCKLSIIFDIDIQKLELLYNELNNKPSSTFNNFNELVLSNDYQNVNLVIEAASVKAAQTYMATILEQGKDVMIMSIGAFSDPAFYETLIQLLADTDRNVFLPSGAIGGADIIRSVKDYIDDVTIVTTKSNKSLKGAPYFYNKDIDIDTIKERKVIFEGNAIDAIKGFPSNVNISALVSLAGIGFEKTRVKIVVDPKIINNQHEIHVKWKFGCFQIKVDNMPSPDNPKTSYLAILSAIECLRGICAKNLKIGS
ncbi:aspartate dehydrogenase [Candidatus Nitrosocosmicus arcticus]|uniref:L-aspartate dehydrogenase n=1 Tax=Candidatus Nitrosocosmicus arcticus TaxID=2035267 RepID=A0A557SUD6_9ARCH|nr:aspartate dehydrogenase [Candidatus Nitrosocosmicus arcticus]TVP40215.1 putative L-aspartate dehydrogenase [Candidatus Nitrosocosmicus arcticus]